EVPAISRPGSARSLDLRSASIRRAPFAFWDGANILNHSLRGAISLNVDEAHHRGLFEAALASVDGCFMVVVGTLLAISPRRPQSIAIDGSLLLIAMLMLSPMTSRSHYVALLFSARCDKNNSRRRTMPINFLSPFAGEANFQYR